MNREQRLERIEYCKELYLFRGLQKDLWNLVLQELDEFDTNILLMAFGISVPDVIATYFFPDGFFGDCIARDRLDLLQWMREKHPEVSFPDDACCAAARHDNRRIFDWLKENHYPMRPDSPTYDGSQGNYPKYFGENWVDDLYPNEMCW